MKPSFYRLFRRSHYVCAPTEQLEDAAVSERQERERFAVAALAFCLKHDKNFRMEFWERICRVTDDPLEMPRIGAEDVLLEPPHWADLRLVFFKNGVRYVWVVEVKAGAPLHPKQNPSKEIFTEKDVGYGFLFAEEERKRGTRMRYIILGAEPPPRIWQRQEELDISLQVRSWEDLLPAMKRNGIVADLSELLAELQIKPFVMKKAKEIIVQSGLNGVGNACVVLDAICKRLDIKRAVRQFEAGTYEDGKGSVGFYIKAPAKKPRPSGPHVKLQKLTKNEGWICWFGYTYDSKNERHVAREVWFYPDEKGRQEALHRRLEQKFPRVRSERDENDLPVVVKSTQEPSIKDFVWFDSVFQAAGCYAS